MAQEKVARKSNGCQLHRTGFVVFIGENIVTAIGLRTLS
jgi:hypothetical protein